jgi:hypothetical protein
MSEQRISPMRPSLSQRFALNESWAVPLLLFSASFLAYLHGNSWGLPNGNDTWANDAIQPGAPLSIFYRLLSGDPWNSGWFWFKYPLGHILLLGVSYAPYIAWLFLTGGIEDPANAYPFGMTDPEGTLAALALIGRSLSALMGAGCVVVLYTTVRSAFGRSAGIAAGLTTAFCYPFIYYAHTTNVEVPYIFWLLIAFMAAARLVEGDLSRRWWVLLGAGAAMSVSTKELGAGFFVALPPVIVVASLARGQRFSDVVGGGLVAGAVAVGVIVIANLVPLNPSGFAHRIGFLTQTLPPDIALKYAPYYFPIDLGSARDLASEIAQLKLAGARLLTSVGFPAALLGLAGMLIAFARKPWWAVLAVTASATFYLLGARAMLSLSMRYVLPIAIVACAFAGIAIGALIDSRKLRPLGQLAAAVFVVYIFAYGWDVNRMLVGDPRYAAEQWLAGRAGDAPTIEVYQRATYLPRTPDGVNMVRVDFDKRSVKELQDRAPDFVMLSSAGLSGVTVQYKRDWKSDDYAGEEWIPSQRATDGTIMNYKRRKNVELLDGLRDGSAGYSKAADFAFEPWIDRPLIQSLSPKITIYARGDIDREATGGEDRGLTE